MYRLTQEILTGQGYDHYEVSNYALPGHQCRHNLTYWHNQPYFGFGMGATSYTNHQRVSRPRTLQTYKAWVADFRAAGGQHPEPVTPLSEQLLDRLMVGLRLKEGIPGTDLRTVCDEATWKQLYSYLLPYIQRGWVGLENETYVAVQTQTGQTFGKANSLITEKILKPANSVGAACQPESPAASSVAPPPLAALKRLKLNDPEGFLFSNVVLADVFQLFPDLLPDT
jgi:oxygen-independent coproporphyrinogen-3 oxidase